MNFNEARFRKIKKIAKVVSLFSLVNLGFMADSESPELPVYKWLFTSIIY